MAMPLAMALLLSMLWLAQLRCEGATTLGSPEQRHEYQVVLNSKPFQQNRQKAFEDFLHYLSGLTNVKVKEKGKKNQQEALFLDTANKTLEAAGFKLRLRRKVNSFWEATLKMTKTTKKEVLSSRHLALPNPKFILSHEEEEEDDPTLTHKLEKDFIQPGVTRHTYSLNLKPKQELQSMLGDAFRMTVAKLLELFPNIPINDSPETPLLLQRHEMRYSVKKIKLKIQGVKVKAILMVVYDFEKPTEVRKVEFSWKLKNHKEEQWTKKFFKQSLNLYNEIWSSVWASDVSTPPAGSGQKDEL